MNKVSSNHIKKFQLYRSTILSVWGARLYGVLGKIGQISALLKSDHFGIEMDTGIHNL